MLAGDAGRCSVAEPQPRLLPAAEQVADDARRWPRTRPQARERLPSPAARMRARPVVRRWQPAIALPPLEHRRDHQLPRPPPLDRAGMAALAVRVRVALAVARLGVRAAAPAHPLVAGLDRPRLLAGRVLEVRLHRRRGATQAIGDLRRSTGPRPRGNAAPGRPPDDARETRAVPAIDASPVTPGDPTSLNWRFRRRRHAKWRRTGWTSYPRAAGRAGGPARCSCRKQSGLHGHRLPP